MRKMTTSASCKDGVVSFLGCQEFRACFFFIPRAGTFFFFKVPLFERGYSRSRQGLISKKLASDFSGLILGSHRAQPPVARFIAILFFFQGMQCVLKKKGPGSDNSEQFFLNMFCMLEILLDTGTLKKGAKRIPVMFQNPSQNILGYLSYISKGSLTQFFEEFPRLNLRGVPHSIFEGFPQHLRGVPHSKFKEVPRPILKSGPSR